MRAITAILYAIVSVSWAESPSVPIPHLPGWQTVQPQFIPLQPDSSNQMQIGGYMETYSPNQEDAVYCQFGGCNSVEGPAATQPAGSTVPVPLKLNPDLSDIVRLRPASSTPSSSSVPAPVASNPYRYEANSTFGPPVYNAPPPTIHSTPEDWAYQQIVAIANATRGVAPIFQPGGISLSKAAAERMALDINIEGIAYRDGRVVLAGSHDNATRIDAGLFLTSLRLACGAYDPYFSLDPVDGAAWIEQADEAAKVVWRRLGDSFNGEPPEKFQIQTLSVNREYPSLWAEISSQFPQLQTRLVFRPEWLKQTRFGEILYKADVLLKELTTGVSIVEPSIPLRANKVPDYVSAEQRRAVRDFLSTVQLNGPPGFRTNRLWFDLMPDAIAGQPISLQDADSKLDYQKLPGLYPVLSARGLVGGSEIKPVVKSVVNWSAEITDLSEIYPKMFVRHHDYAKGQDTAGVDPDLERIARDVDRRTSVYSQAYQELRDLTDIFRAYVANVSIVRQKPEVCRAAQMPLSDGEKISAALPEFRPNELTITVAHYTWNNNGRKAWQLIEGSSINGGISLRGKQFYSQAATQNDTKLISEMRQMLAAEIPAQRWRATTSGREYIAFDIDARDPPAKVPIVAGKAAN